MKKYLVLFCFILFGALPLACHSPFPISPAPVPTPAPFSTPTSVTTPVCGYTNVSVPYPSPSAVAAALYPSNPGAHYFVVRDAADWQAYCGSSTPPAPPVDLGSQMLLIVASGWICGLHPSFASVCETGSNVVATVNPPGIPACYYVINGTVAVAVNNTSLPVTWNILPSVP